MEWNGYQSLGGQSFIVGVFASRMVLPELRQGEPSGGQKIGVHQEMLLNLSGSSEELSALVLVLQAESDLSLREGKKA